MRRPVDFTGHGRDVERLLVHVLWLTSGLSCDGESVSLTAATSPSLEELLRGAIPGQPRIALYNPLLAYDVGDDYLRAWHAAARGELDPFVLVVEGSVAERGDQRRGALERLRRRCGGPADHRQRPGSTGSRRAPPS